MRYRRWGSGRTVLLLGAGDEPGALWPGLVDALALEFRLIEPDLADQGTDVASWVTDFLDGLGAALVAVVATDRRCASAIELVLLGADRFAGLVLVPSDKGCGPPLDGTLADCGPPAPVPLLVVPRGLPASEAIALIVRFLARAGTAPAA